MFLVTECLQYPDFSCVVLYKKLVIGFAFMVPDASYNMAYISFIYTHPEWRRAGIASFMLYHLIQVITQQLSFDSHYDSGKNFVVSIFNHNTRSFVIFSCLL